jgi:indole-3-glycerol phosphate synthase
MMTIKAAPFLLLLLSERVFAGFVPWSTSSTGWHNNNHSTSHWRHYFASRTTTTTSSSSCASSSSSSSTCLHAIGALAKKAKQVALKEYVNGGISDDVMTIYKDMKAKMDSVDLASSSPSPGGPLQQSLTKRKGTITVIAEYKRKNSEMSSENGGFINSQIYDPELLSPTFREFGASAIAVMADERMGGCTYDDIATFVEEQRRAKNKVPGPVPVINNDLIIDELQVARSKALRCAACVIHLPLVGANDTSMLLRACQAADIEAIVAVSSHEQAQQAIDLGAQMISVIYVDGVEDKVKVVADLNIHNDRPVCTIANILARDNKQLQEVEEAWALRDKGYNAVWVGEALYKSGADFTEHPGAIIKAMKSKSSVKWASPKASSGRGEGAREYLGDILM